jgi:hypothetical protein
MGKDRHCVGHPRDHATSSAISDIAQLYSKIALTDEVKHDTYMGTGPSPTGREIADIVKQHLPDAEITFDEKARVPA